MKFQAVNRNDSIAFLMLVLTFGYNDCTFVDTRLDVTLIGALTLTPISLSCALSTRPGTVFEIPPKSCSINWTDLSIPVMHDGEKGV